jgi:predicted RNA-binding protein with PUA-like domain
VKALKKPVTLDEMKGDPTLRDMPLIRQSRLSVLPLTESQAQRIAQLAETAL